MLTRDQLLSALKILKEGSDQEQVDALVAAGFERLEARKLTTFLPLAFGRAVIEANWKIDFGETVSAMTRTGTWVQIALREVPTYEAALSLARESYRTGLFPRELSSAIAGRSAEIKSLSNSLDAGYAIDHATSHSTLIDLSAEELGYGSLWFRIWTRLSRLLG
jgi:hypothetical protein